MQKKSDRNRQQKRQRHARKRKQAKQEAAVRAAEKSLPKGPLLVELAQKGKLGPAWISVDYDDPARLRIPVEVVISRKLPGGKLLAYSLIVDRSCLGVMNATLLDPASVHELSEMFASDDDADTLMPCDISIAQSVVLHAIQYAASLGLRPVAGFDVKWLEPRPPALLDTPGAQPVRPFYAPDPEDDPRPVFWKLVEKLGIEGFDYEFEDSWVSDEIAAPDHPWEPADKGAVPGRIDWRAATERTRSEVFYLDEDLVTMNEDSLRDITDILIWRLSDGYFLRWEAKLRREQGLMLSEAQAAALADDKSREDRPREPWYQTLRRFAPVLADWFRTRPTWWVDTPLGARLVAAVETHARVLSLPHGCRSVSEVLPEELWHRLRVQSVYSALVGLGSPGPNDELLTIDNAPELLDELINGLNERQESLRALGWSTRDLLDSFMMPDDERDRVMRALNARGFSDDWPRTP